MLSFIPSFTETMQDWEGESKRSRTRAQEKIRFENTNKESASWGNQWNAHVQPRVANAAFAIGNVFAGIVDMAVGAVEEVVDIASFGYVVDEHRARGSRFTDGAENIVSAPFKNVIHVLNPAANFPSVDLTNDYIRKASLRIGEVVYIQQRKSQNIFVKHVVTRFCAVMSCLASIVARIVFLVVGIFAAIGSILSLGNWTAANKWASYGLTFPLIINDVGVLLKRFTRLD